MKATRLGILALAILALVAVFAVPRKPGKAIYEGVGSAHGQRIITNNLCKPFIIENGKLFLVKQETWYSVILLTHIKRFEWTGPKLEELKTQFPELRDESLWK